LKLWTPHGGAPGGGLAFGEFPGAERQAGFGPELVSDARDAGSDVFVFRTREGKLVSARIHSRAGARVVIDYVLLR
jgi:hypothetical protein